MSDHTDFIHHQCTVTLRACDHLLLLSSVNTLAETQSLWCETGLTSITSKLFSPLLCFDILSLCFSICLNEINRNGVRSVMHLTLISGRTGLSVLGLLLADGSFWVSKTLATFALCFSTLLNEHLSSLLHYICNECCSYTLHFAWHPAFSAEVYFCYKRCATALYRSLKVLHLMSFALPYSNLSTRLLYVNTSSLSRCETQVFIFSPETRKKVLNIVFFSCHYIV